VVEKSMCECLCKFARMCLPPCGIAPRPPPYKMQNVAETSEEPGIIKTMARKMKEVGKNGVQAKLVKKALQKFKESVVEAIDSTNWTWGSLLIFVAVVVFLWGLVKAWKSPLRERVVAMVRRGVRETNAQEPQNEPIPSAPPLSESSVTLEMKEIGPEPSSPPEIESTPKKTKPE
jgi:hypothetical protein